MAARKRVAHKVTSVARSTSARLADRDVFTANRNSPAKSRAVGKGGARMSGAAGRKGR